MLTAGRMSDEFTGNVYIGRNTPATVSVGRYEVRPQDSHGHRCVGCW